MPIYLNSKSESFIEFQDGLRGSKVFYFAKYTFQLIITKGNIRTL